jgi:hypothetical protein
MPTEHRLHVQHLALEVKGAKHVADVTCKALGGEEELVNVYHSHPTALVPVPVRWPT